MMRSMPAADPRKRKPRASSASNVPSHITGSPAATMRRPPTRERLLIAAESVWNDAGFAQARIEDVLQVADVSRATFYQHFDGKEDLAAALLERAITLLLASAASRSQAGASFEDKVALALDAYLELWQRHGRIVQELTAEALRPGSKLGPMRQRAVDAAVDVLGAQFHLERGKRIDPLTVRHLILGIEAVLMHLRIDGPVSRARLHATRASLLALILHTVGG
jgi:AcrR family transcriptional regulator